MPSPYEKPTSISPLAAALRPPATSTSLWDQVMGINTRGFTMKDVLGDPPDLSRYLAQITPTENFTRIVKQFEEQNRATAGRMLQQLAAVGINPHQQMMRTIGMQYRTSLLPDVRSYVQGEADSALRSIAEQVAQQGVITAALKDKTRARLDFLQAQSPGAVTSVLARSPEVQDLADKLEDDLADEVVAVQQVVALRQGSLSPGQLSDLAGALVTYFTANFPAAGVLGADPVGAFILSTLVLVLALRKLDYEAASAAGE